QARRGPACARVSDMAEQLVPMFRVDDAAVAVAWYRRLGFDPIGEHRFAPGLPLYVFLRRGDVHLHLSEHVGDAPPRSLAYFYVEAIAPIADEFGATVEVQPWALEVELTDPFGNRVRIGQ